MLLWPTFVGRDSDFVLSGMYASARSLDPLEQTLSVYQKDWLVEDLLMKADKMSMAASLELRVPFLDYRLVEWANRQPSPVKIGRTGLRFVTKRVLRRFAAKRLPRQIIQRPKRGFWVPVCEWLKDETFSRWTREHLLGPRARSKSIFEAAVIDEHLRQANTGDIPAAYRIWVLIVLETWLREYDVELDDYVSCPQATLVGD
jgi:asparagine synthase (glutamine-hydrolysing)